jgi:hypothetical protein
MKESGEYKAFTEALEKVLSVSHPEIKQLEAADRLVKKYTGRKRKPKRSASEDRASRRKG